MKAYLYGRLDKPVVAVIGVWDPLLPAHKVLFGRLSKQGVERSLSTLVIAIDPDPVRYLWGVSSRPIYNDVLTRIQQILHCGIDAVLRIHFVQRDIDATAADFFKVVDPQAQIAELCLGARQSLGRCRGGNFDAITEAANVRGMQVNRLPYERLDSGKVRDLLQSGRLIEAANIVGRPPIQSRPASGNLRLAWQPGLYQALPTPDPNVIPKGDLLTLALKKEGRRLPSLDWPDDQTKYLAFVYGPHDVHVGTT